LFIVWTVKGCSGPNTPLDGDHFLQEAFGVGELAAHEVNAGEHVRGVERVVAIRAENAAGTF
jgi:hypothetical protein